MNIYVGNLSQQVTDEELRKAFEAFGTVSTATIIKDRISGETKGFGFVEMPAKPEAQGAITAMDGKELGGKLLIVNEARPRTPSTGGNRRERRY